MLAPPKPPPQPELDALIREARERQRRRRRLFATALVAGTAAAALSVNAVLSGGKPDTTRGHARRPLAVGSLPGCRSSQLRLSLGRGGVAAGTDVERFIFTNSSTQTCTLRGWPTLHLVESGGRSVATRPRLVRDMRPGRKPWLPVHTVVLRSRGAATFNVFMVIGGLQLDKCATTRTILVAPPGARDPIRIQAGLTYCGRRWLSVSPIVAGRVDEHWF